MKIGILGLPNVGKSTLFNALSGAAVPAANYPFCTIEPNVATVAVPDSRLDWLEALYHPKKVTHTTIEFVDIAGLVAGASSGEGLGNRFLSHIREVDALLHVVRCFGGDEVTHVTGKIDPVGDITVIDTELILADIEVVERRLLRAEKAAKGQKEAQLEAMFLKELLAFLSAGKNARDLEADEHASSFLNSLHLLSAKPVIYAANLSDEELFSGAEHNLYYQQVAALAHESGSGILAISAQAEAELAVLSPEERADFLSDLHIEESSLDMLIRESYRLLGLISFLTAGEPEVRAWAIKMGTRAPEAAGKIHSDLERGFIRAETVSFDVLKKEGSMAAVREKGLLRSEGKTYVVEDGDVILFRFNV